MIGRKPTVRRPSATAGRPRLGRRRPEPDRGAPVHLPHLPPPTALLSARLISSTPCGPVWPWRCVCLVAVALPARGPASAQVRPVYDIGAAGLVQLLERLQTTASVLHTGAHPDDEDSALLARAARGDHARVAYLSLNRGEGGQNIIGTELFDALGVIRTEELLQARRLDGGEQFFTRTFDYGFSKTRDEAAAKWNEREVLGDMVRVIRTFRPLVIYSRFSGTPADGHGQHQMAGYLTPLAFKAAGDPTQFPEQIAGRAAAVAAEEALSRRRLPARPGERADASGPDRRRRSARSAAPTPRSPPRDAASTSRRRWAASSRSVRPRPA